MVDVQTVGVLATAASVSVAAIYYSLILREQNRNRRIALTNSVVQQISSPTGVRAVIEQFQMKWDDFKDFEAKYDSATNLDNSTTRHYYWIQMDTLGYLLKMGLVDREIIYISGGWMAMMLWRKFKPLIDEFRSRQMGLDAYRDFEYLAYEMYKMKLERDPGFHSHQDLPMEVYEKAFPGLVSGTQ